MTVNQINLLFDQIQLKTLTLITRSTSDICIMMYCMFSLDFQRVFVLAS